MSVAKMDTCLAMSVNASLGHDHGKFQILVESCCGIHRPLSMYVIPDQRRSNHESCKCSHKPYRLDSDQNCLLRLDEARSKMIPVIISASGISWYQHPIMI